MIQEGYPDYLHDYKSHASEPEGSWSRSPQLSYLCLKYYLFLSSFIQFPTEASDPIHPTRREISGGASDHISIHMAYNVRCRHYCRERNWEILHIGVRNKYCTGCAQNEKSQDSETPSGNVTLL